MDSEKKDVKQAITDSIGLSITVTPQSGQIRTEAQRLNEHREVTGLMDMAKNLWETGMEEDVAT